ncbi:YT521-B-like domain-containing protein [Obelidium mucronatum]|nr:YT521-B-like domain-containing protein [Obelidium mucronatum]
MSSTSEESDAIDRCEIVPSVASFPDSVPFGSVPHYAFTYPNYPHQIFYPPYLTSAVYQPHAHHHHHQQQLVHQATVQCIQGGGGPASYQTNTSTLLLATSQEEAQSPISPPNINHSTTATLSNRAARVPQLRMCRIDDRSNRVVCVGNLPLTADDRSLRTYFLSIGGFAITALNHIKSNQTAFIQLESSQNVPEFIRIFNGSFLLGCQLQCWPGKPQPPRRSDTNSHIKSVRHFQPFNAVHQEPQQQQQQNELEQQQHQQQQIQHQQALVNAVQAPYNPLSSMVTTTHPPPFTFPQYPGYYTNFNNNNTNTYHHHQQPQFQQQNQNQYNQQYHHLHHQNTAPSTQNRYFIMKSFSQADIQISQSHNIWSTNVKNEAKLNKAFRSLHQHREHHHNQQQPSAINPAAAAAAAVPGNVFLIFSVNGSGGVAGVALMTNVFENNRDDGWSSRRLQVVVEESFAPATESVDSNQNDNRATLEAGLCDESAAQSSLELEERNLEDGEESAPDNKLWDNPFPVKWIMRHFVPFRSFDHLVNPWNDNKPVRMSRNATELEPAVGEELIKILAH